MLTVLLVIAGLRPVHAFNIIPAKDAASKLFVPSLSYELDKGKTGLVARDPIAFASIARGGTEGFLVELKAEFPESRGWKFLVAADDLKGSFSVGAYYVFYNGTVGGGFAFDYTPKDTDPVTAGDIELHWIQRIVSDHNKNLEHGVPENRIAFKGMRKNKMRPDVPFFDIVFKNSKSRSVPPHFEYDVGKNDSGNDHLWSSEVYLASINKNDPKTVTLYNGVKWGWTNKVVAEVSFAPLKR